MSSSADAGVVVYLSDSSAWEVRTENRAKVAKWPHGGRIGVYRTDDHDYPYRLVLRPGSPDGEIVSAKRLMKVR